MSWQLALCSVTCRAVAADAMKAEAALLVRCFMAWKGAVGT